MTRKGVWDLQDVRDKYLAGEWEQQFELWGWGTNSYGNLGQNNRTEYSSPIQIPGTQWSSIDGGENHSLAIKTDGTLFAWGNNRYGQLGQNTVTPFPRGLSSPVQIPGTNWSSISGSSYNSFAIKTDGTLWAWGFNEWGQLAQNDRTHYSSPVQIPGNSWGSIDSFYQHSLATKTDGTLWTWGRSVSGSLGQNDNIRYSSPVQIPGNTWSSFIAGSQHSLATKTDGTLWAWGSNGLGNLGQGQGDAAHHSSPVQIPGNTWSSVSGSGGSHSLATKTDGTLWVWGNNTNGQLGQNDTARYSSPVQIPGTNWSSFSGGTNFSLATKTDSTLWGWGNNQYGQIGQNQNYTNTGYYSSPVQIPGTQWSSITTGGYHSLAIKKLLTD